MTDRETPRQQGKGFEAVEHEEPGLDGNTVRLGENARLRFEDGPDADWEDRALDEHYRQIEREMERGL
ncbi:MAG: hypothetical protein WD492_12680 [Alkalispirochaeta sp.]